jgi:hypothetical protein
VRFKNCRRVSANPDAAPIVVGDGSDELAGFREMGCCDMNSFYRIHPSSAILLVKKQVFPHPVEAISSRLPHPVPQRFCPWVRLQARHRFDAEDESALESKPFFPTMPGCDALPEMRARP